MKRNLFKLLVAFIALAAFQTNALSQGNGVGYDGEKAYFLHGFNGYGTLGGNLSSKLSYVHDVYPDTSLMPTGALTLGSDNLFKYKTSIPEFGSSTDYFTIKNVKTGQLENGVDKYGQFRIQSKTSGRYLEFTRDNQSYNVWELVQFSDVLGNTFKDPITKDPVSDGGYLSVPSAAKADGVRFLVVRDKFNELSLVTYQEYMTDSLFGNSGFKPVFIKAQQISGRWARLSDFKSFPDFIKIKSVSGNGTPEYLTVSEVSNFKIVRTNAFHFDATTAGNSLDKTVALSTELPAGSNLHCVEIFSFIAPSAGGKLITVDKNSNVFETQGSTSGSVFGDKLSLKAPSISVNESSQAGPTTGNQQFAIWLDDDGALTLYPYWAWTHVFGQPNLSAIIYNKAITRNNHIVDSIQELQKYIGDGDKFEEYFKIGYAKYELANGQEPQYVAGPTRYADQTAYVDAKFMLQDITKYNYVAEKRYFYLQTNYRNSEGGNLVLDVVRQYTSQGSPKFQNKLVLTDKEKVRHEHMPYYNIPYDSLNLSAYWQFDAVYNTDYDPDITLANRRIVGYKIANELGDVLRFARNRPGGNTVWNNLGLGNAHETDAYLDSTKGGSDFFNDSIIGTDVWKVLNYADDTNDNRLFLENVAGAAYKNGTNDFLEPKFINGWGVTVDLAKRRDMRLDVSTGYAFTNPLGSEDFVYPSQAQNCYYISTATNAADVDTRRSYYGTTLNVTNDWQHCTPQLTYGASNAVGGVVQRNLAMYSDNYYTWNGADDPNAYFDVNNVPGLELELVPIEFDKPDPLPGSVKHDSIGFNGEQLWERYAVDSLFNYFYKEGTYAITEAIGHTDILSFNPSDERVFVGHTDVDSAEFEVELVDSLMISRLTNHGTGKDSTKDVYKWYTLKSKRTGKYMTFDVLNPALTTTVDQFGFHVDERLRQNATRFRFYQPLVDDKRRDNFIMEVIVPEHYYTNVLYTDGHGNTKYEIDGDRGDHGERDFKLSNVVQAGMTYYAVIQKGSNKLNVTTDVKQATRWTPWVKEFSRCRIDYIDNNFLGDTRMFGAPLTAERWSEDNTYSGDFISMANVADRVKNTVVEGADEVVTFTLVPAALITPDGKVTCSYTTNGNTPNAVIAGANYNFGTETRPVQLYYIRKDVRTDKTILRTFLTVTNQTVYSKALKPNMVASVAGAKLDFQPGYALNLNLEQDPATKTDNEPLLQMFAIYGKLGLDSDRKNPDGTWNTSCISPADSAFHFGVFSLLPAASWNFDFQSGTPNTPGVPKPMFIERNVNIGNRSIADEFRVTDYTFALDGYKRQLVVEPGGPQGIPASEYVFSYVPYIDAFKCPNFIDKYTFAATGGTAAVSPFVSDGRTTNVFYRDYADPSQQWAVKRVSEDKSTFDYYAYEFAPVDEYTRTQAPAKHKVLMDRQYLFLVKKETHTTAYGDVGYKDEFTAIKQYKKVNGKYDFPAKFDEIFQPMLIQEITNKFVGDVKKVDKNTRKYNGDSTIDFYHKFTEDELVNLDWAVIEAVYKDRYMWSREFKVPVADSKEAFIDSSKAKYLTLKQSYTKVMGNCNGVDLHKVPYYNIVYTSPNTGDEYYLELDQKGNATFILMTEAGKDSMANYNNNTVWDRPGQGESTHRPGMVFCFPYKMKNNNPDYNRIEYVGEGYGENPNTVNVPCGDGVDPAKCNQYYDQPKVFIQSFATFDAIGNQLVYPYIVKVTANSATLAGEPVGNLYDIDYRKDLNATTWFFGHNGVADQEWVRLQGVPHVSAGWMRDAGRPETSDYYVAKTTTPENGVDFAQLSYRKDFSDINIAKLQFIFIDSAYIGSYDKKNVWYYQIKNEAGEFLTSSGFKQGSSNSYGADYTLVNEGYAFFSKDSIGNDTKYRQLFGLKKIKNADPTQPDPYNFWVVAGVDSMMSNIATSDYYYLAGINERLVFRDGGGTKRQEAENTAMKFQYGQSTSDKYTDIDKTAADGLSVYGVEGAVKVVNASGTIDLYTVDGRLLKSVRSTGTIQTIPAPKGIVIAKNGLNVVKVVVK